MKHIPLWPLRITLPVTLMLLLLTACGHGQQGDGKERTLQVVTTIYPEYDWVMEILGENPADIQVSLLQDNGADLHSFQPTAADMRSISTCDLFLYVGGESDQWVTDALKGAANENRIVLNLLDLLGDLAREEEVAEGMQSDEAEGEEEAYDEHVWLSLRNTAVFCDAITSAIDALDPANAPAYDANASRLQESLAALDGQYTQALSECDFTALLFADRFPFRYLTEDYDLDYYAAFPGCSAESAASFQTITFLAGKLDELGLPCVLTIDGSDQAVAKTVVASSQKKSQAILTLNSMQTQSTEDYRSGQTYLSIMEENLSVLKEALGYHPDQEASDAD